MTNFIWKIYSKNYKLDLKNFINSYVEEKYGGDLN